MNPAKRISQVVRLSYAWDVSPDVWLVHSVRGGWDDHRTVCMWDNIQDTIVYKFKCSSEVMCSMQCTQYRVEGWILHTSTVPMAAAVYSPLNSRQQLYNTGHMYRVEIHTIYYHLLSLFYPHIMYIYIYMCNIVSLYIYTQYIVFFTHIISTGKHPTWFQKLFFSCQVIRVIPQPSAKLTQSTFSCDPFYFTVLELLLIVTFIIQPKSMRVQCVTHVLS